ncbi:MAG: YgiQ family radical SAM protein [Bacteroidaceae bacterium]|nr:YgiQ family radical SAM protein [Bacteroidaceae bacterium]
MKEYKIQNWLPTTKKEIDIRGWDYIDVILFSGDAYVDHPSFGAAVLGRTLEAYGLRVAIVPQPNWRDDLRDFKKLGKPKLFFGVSAGAMDSMVNRYTANKRLRSDDAYTPDGRPDMRPDYTTIVYSRILKDLFPDVPVVIGGIEASMRRLAHYDYWENRLRPSILLDCPADLLIYGMGERPIIALSKRLLNGEKISDIQNLPQTACVTSRKIPANDKNNLVLHPYEECLKSKKRQSENTQHIDEESHRYSPRTIWQTAADKTIVVNPPYPPMTEKEIDASFDLPYTRMPHPKYKGKTIPAYEMIKFSVNTHRGCFGGCSFCAISAHQGKYVSSRSKESILKEVKQITEMPGFAGYLSDLGGPSANMYKMEGRNKEACKKCGRPSCLYPEVCKNLDTNHQNLLDLYRSVDKIKGIKKSFIGSGIRYDMLIHRNDDEKINAINREYTEELIAKHVSGRLKVAPEHTSEQVLNIMRKPSFKLFEDFKRTFDKINAKYGLNQQIIPYFISSHPGCTEEDMAELAVITKRLHFQLEQIQDFTPTPMTISTEMYYTGYNPTTKKPIYTAHTKEEKLAQRQFFFWYKPDQRKAIENSLKKINRPDLFQQLYSHATFQKKKSTKPYKK